MKTINIEINQAKLLSYSVDMEDDKPEITATIGLYAGSKQISTFLITTKDYYSGIKFKPTPDIINPIVEIAQRLEYVVIRECSKALGELPAPEAE